MLFIRLLASSCQSFLSVWFAWELQKLIYWTPAWSHLQVHLYSPYRIHTGGQAQTAITKKSWMFKISLNHANAFVGKSPNQPTNKRDTHKYEMSAETYRWILTNKRRIQLFENSQSVSSRPPSHCDTLSAPSSANPTWGAESHGEELFTWILVPSRINKQLLRRFGTSPEPSQQAGRVTRCHTQSHTLLLAHQNFGAWFLIKAVLFQINTPEKCWVASTSFLSSF